jgi:hypothetical protein
MIMVDKLLIRKTASFVLLQLVIWLLMTLAGCSNLPIVFGYRTSMIQGYVVHVNADFIRRQPKLVRQVTSALNEDLGYINRALPAPARAALQKTIIWVEYQTPSFGDDFRGRGATFHVSRLWLAEHGFLLDKARGVQVCNAADYLDWRSHQMLLLHEFTHAYHYIIGFERSDVIAAYKAAKKAGLYHQVQYVLAKPGELKSAYALNNQHEYFAELSEAYLARNDYFPFIREDLRQYDPNGYELIDRLWNFSADQIRQAQAEHKQMDD